MLNTYHIRCITTEPRLKRRERASIVMQRNRLIAERGELAQGCARRAQRIGAVRRRARLAFDSRRWRVVVKRYEFID